MFSEVEGMYRLRGANREKAVALGLSIEYHHLVCQKRQISKVSMLFSVFIVVNKA